ncbi:hypothetical protein EST38_g5083 [Candolleomyces aberdarensis]|uniref:Nephrocystin 3-like N-terminal domain-containing protein n=1 Tax=Candolleomyces aberdarensis TaxID=2316362 RepID=A0A4Q2DKZ2_9AGAR|nr:hypothetical protein EST38_g5083 [Candolleomyces aberdarensis]
MHDSDERFPPPLCHPGTREAVICRILDWYGYQAGPRKPIMWVHAPAGYGKTAIAGTVAEKLEEQSEELGFSLIGATFFFWRTSPERNSPARFIITLAYQLATSIPELTPHIENAVKRNPMILRKALEVQLKKLIVEPFKATEDVKDLPNRLIIIDGLDECINSDRESRVEKKYAEDQEIVQVRVLDLVRVLASHQLPLSFLILSRPETWIKQHTETQQLRNRVEIVDLYKIGDHMNDVEKFVRAELARIAESLEHHADGGPEGWPGEVLVRRFMQKSGGHMLYTSTVIRHIDSPYGDARERLRNILDRCSGCNSDLTHSTPFSSLYKLYLEIMRACPEANRSLMVEVLEDMVVTNYKFHFDAGITASVAILDRLSGRAQGSGMKALRGLHAILHLGERGTINHCQSLNFFLHSSFFEFLQTPTLSLEFAVDLRNGERRLLSRCLDRMSLITLQSKIHEDDVQFSLSHWASILRTLEPSDKSEYLAVVKRLLSIDLIACIAQGYINPNRNAVRELYLCVSVACPSNVYFGECPIVQHHISLLRSLVESAYIFLLDQTHLNGNRWNPTMAFKDDLTYLLAKLYNGQFGYDHGWEHTRTVQALVTLRHKRRVVFDELMEVIKEGFPDCVDEGEEDFAIIAYLLQEDK